VDFDSSEVDCTKIPSLQRGSLCLLVRGSLKAEAFLLQKKEGPLNMAQWRLMSPKWSSNIVLGRVYRSPSENTTSAVAEQFQHIESFMDPPRPDMNRKHDILLMVGDLNTKTGLVDAPLLSPPQISRKNFAYECTVGEQLNLSEMDDCIRLARV
jgi:hypothetical protein